MREHTQPRMGTRWGRTSVMAITGVTAMAGILSAAQAQLVSSQLVVSQGATSQVASSGLRGSDVGLGMAETQMQPKGGGTPVTKKVLRAGFADGKLDGLCLSQEQSVAGATFTLVLSAGDGQLGTYEIVGKNAQLDVNYLRGTSATGSAGNGINLDGRAMLGVAAHDITTTSTGGLADVNPLDAPTGVGWYGIDADEGIFYNFRADVYNVVIGGPFSMPGLKIDVLPGAGKGCNSRALPK